MALPIALQNLINSFVNVLDTVMVGRLGTVEIAAVGLGNQVFFLYNMILFGICSGSTVFIAQYWGKQDGGGIKRTTGLCVSLALGVGALFTILCGLFPSTVISLYSSDPAVIASGAAYLRALSPAFIPYAVSFSFTLVMRSVEKVRLPIVSTIISLSVNLLLNWLLIFGVGPFPALGVVGAALGTVASRLIEAVILVEESYRRSYPFAGRLAELLGFDGPFFRRFLRIALPVMLNETVWALGVSLQNVIMARTGTDAMAAFSIVNTISQLTWVLFIGLGNGAGVLVGKKIGEGATETARSYASLITRFAPLLSILIASLLFPLSKLLPIFFVSDGRVFEIAGRMFLILALSYPFRAFNMSMVVGVCRAGGDTLFCAVYDLLFMWTLALPSAALASFVFGAPVWLVYLCIASEEPFKMLFGRTRLKSGKWLRDVTA